MPAPSQAVASSTPASTLVVEAAAPHALVDAWHRVQSGGRAAGIDHVSLDAFEQQLDQRLHVLAQQLGTGRYAPGPLRRVYIPKESGGHRPIGIPSVIDRVAQTSIASLLQDRLDPTFSPVSFAYRPGRGPRRAAERAAHLARTAATVVNTDLERFFDNVDHEVLRALLRIAGIDAPSVDVIITCLKVPVVDEQHWLSPLKGLPQGSPLAPVLANLYLSEFDTRLSRMGIEHVRFADDFVVFADSDARGADLLDAMSTYLASERKLKLKPEKTAVRRTVDGFVFLGFLFQADVSHVAPAKLERFRAEAEKCLRDPMPATGDVVRTVNDLIRGWRNYFGGFSPGVASDLAALDAWLREPCARFLESRGQPRAAAPLLFETMCDGAAARAAAGPIGGYGGPDPAPAAAPQETGPAAPFASAPKPRAARVTARETHTLAVATDLTPTLSSRGELFVPTPGAFVTARGQAITVLRQRVVVFEAAFDEVRRVTLAGAGLVVSTQLAAACTQRGIDIELIDLAGRLVGSLPARQTQRRRHVAHAQLRATRSRRGAIIAARVVAGKLRNQRALVLCHAKYAGRPADTRRLLLATAHALHKHAKVAAAADGPLNRAMRQRLFLEEARGAASYWHAFRTLVPPQLRFPGRRGRGATDPVNSLLNYGYQRLYARVHAAVRHAHLVPWLGLLHSGRKGGDALVLDFMEEFRPPIVDRTVLGLLGRGFRPAMRPDHRLSLRTRRVLETALSRAWERPTSRMPRGVADALRQQSLRLRNAFVDGAPYSPFAMTW
jgi:CRISPR-associated protein Cas1